MSPDAASSTYTCSVCGESAEAAMTAECNWCNARFHLNQRSDVESKDCGQVWVDEQYLALQFACNACLAGTDRDPAAANMPFPAEPASARPPGLSVTRLRRYKRRS